MKVKFDDVQRWCALSNEPFPKKEDLSPEDAAIYFTPVQLAHVIPHRTTNAQVSSFPAPLAFYLGA